jgi:uncharacterized protein involved in type VI secretion and phage assembly
MAERDLFGVYRATVTESKDPEGRGRVRVTIPSVDPGEQAWAELATLMAGDGYGTWFRPDPGDEVLVAFEAGDLRRPFVIGALWGAGERTPPTTADTAKIIRTRCGATITVDDGHCEIRIDAPGGIRLSSSSRIEGKATEIVLDTGQLAVNSANAVFSGVVRCDTLVAESVVAARYSPGAGNVM